MFATDDTVRLAVCKAFVKYRRNCRRDKGQTFSDGSSFFWYRLKMTNPSESEIMSTTILVDVQLQRTDTGEHDASLHELRQLIETLGWKIAGTLTQKLSSLTAA